MNIRKTYINILLIHFTFIYCQYTNSDNTIKKPDILFTVSIPKCGTNLLIKVINSITKKNGSQANANDHLIIDKTHFDISNTSFLVTHSCGSAENIRVFNDYGNKGIFIYRDPRDQIISFLYHIQKNPEWPNLLNFNNDELISQLIMNASLIYGPKGWLNPSLLNLKGIDTFYQLYLPWATVQGVYTITFEELIGSPGGGSNKIQFKAIQRLANHIGYDLTDEEIIYISK